MNYGKSIKGGKKMEENKKEKKQFNFNSKKFFLCVLVILLAFGLKWYQVIQDWPFVALVVIVMIFYFLVQGKIDLDKIKEFAAAQFSIKMEDGPLKGRVK
jgi:membrane protein YdbS with pleckstrin-like domain